MTGRTRARALAVLIALAVAGCGGEAAEAPGARRSPTPDITVGPTPDAAATTPSPSAADDARVVRLSVSNGEVTRESRRVDVRRGERVRIEVTSDVADEVHLHTYDVKAPVTPGTTATLEFEATIPGQFEVELEESHLLLVVIAVR